MAEDQFNNIDKAIDPAQGDIIDMTKSMSPERLENFESIEVIPTEDDGVEIFFNEDTEQTVMLLGEEPEDFFGNLVDKLSDETKVELSNSISASVEEDKNSRDEWEDAYVKGLKLLGMKYEERTQPFAGATGVVHPVLNEAVTQFQASAYKEMLPSSGPVRAQIIGKTDKDQEARAKRVQEYMNYTIMHEMEEYEPEFDQMLYFLGLAGSTFKKVYMDELLGRPVSKFVPSEDIVVNYSATDLKSADRVTHVISISSNELRKLQVNGVYSGESLGEYGQGLQQNEVQEAYDDIQGMSSGYGDKDFTLFESHCYLDLEEYPDTDEENEPTGVKLPYIVTICKETSDVLAVRRNYREDDPNKNKIPHFVQYKFTPGLGFYGFGLIHLLGNLSRTATANLRQLIDSGTLSNMPSGFKARGMRISDEDVPLNPGEFRDVDVPGSDLKGSIVPLPYKEPSGTLFQLMGFVVDAAQRFIGNTDLGVGNISNVNGDMPVGTTIAMLERGSRIVSAVHKRLHASMKQELKMLSVLLKESAQPYPYQTDGDLSIKSEDFDDRIDILPVSDPNIFSMSQRVMLAQEQLRLAQAAPLMHNMYEAYHRVYLALGVKDIDKILPPMERETPVDPITENLNASKAAEGMLELKAFKEQDHDAHIAVHLAYQLSPVAQLQPRVLLVLEKHIYEHIALKAEILAEKSLQSAQGEVISAQFESQKARIQSQLVMEYQQQKNSMSQASGAQQTDPLVALKQQELQLRQQDQMADQQIDQAELALKQQKLALDRQKALGG